MLTSTNINMGKLSGIVYDFSEVNDELPAHTHPVETGHISIVGRGSFKAHGDGWELTLTSGNVVDWPDNQAHGFIALEPGSRLVNIVKA